MIPNDIIKLIYKLYPILAFWLKCGDKIKIVDDKTIKTDKYLLQSAYYGPIISVMKGYHIWKVQWLSRPGSDDAVGVSTNTDYHNTFWFNKNYIHYVYTRLSNKKKQNFEYTNYGEGYGQNDIISIKLDLNNKTIGFAKNDKDFGTAFDNIETSDNLIYVLAICVGNSDEKVKVLSYEYFDNEPS